MAATISITPGGREGEGDLHLVVFDFTTDTAYPAGGYPLTGFGGLIMALIGNLAGYLVRFDPANQKLMLYRQTAATGALAEVPNGTDISAAGSARLAAVVQGS